MGKSEELVFGIKNLKAYSSGKLRLEDPLSGNAGVKISSIQDTVRLDF
jgi:hypothetical protein